MRNISHWVLAFSLGAVACTAVSAEGERKSYIVQLSGNPTATQITASTASTAGAAARGAQGPLRYNARSAAALSYARSLELQQDAVAAAVGAPILRRYTHAYNGFLVRLDASEVAALKRNPNVRAVYADEMRTPSTVSTPGFLGLTAPGGLWSMSANGQALKGEDVIIGVIDSGVWPESPSYAARISNGAPVFQGGVLAYGPPPKGWNGSCESGEGFDAAVHCNNKLIGARYFKQGLSANELVLHWTDFASARDAVGFPLGDGGHGTHTSTTAGGNAGVATAVGGVMVGAASGIAPRARIAAYKVCWTFAVEPRPDGSTSANGCFTSDSVAAIDQAVADGVHVINYSVSGGRDGIGDPVEQAFMHATRAGIFVAASGGNSGPGRSVEHASPWLTTVGASTHDRLLRANVVLGSGETFVGAGFNREALPAKPVINAVDARADTALAADAGVCLKASAGLPALDPAKAAGKIVICTRGVNARLEKSAAVAAAGGAGMILVDDGLGIVGDVHAVPSVHVTAADGAAIRRYVAAATSPTAALTALYAATAPAPVMADFSSRGPSLAYGGILKPDLTAPGVDVIASVSPSLTQRQRQAVANGTLVPATASLAFSGTSMSSPHVAGLAALLRQAHPAWSPAAIKSALMTTTYPTLDDGLPLPRNGLLPWAQGAGHVNPNRAIDPGLVYDSGAEDFIRFQCRYAPTAVDPADCARYGTLDTGHNYNLPSVTAAAIGGEIVIRRRVTNVAASPATYTASISVPGFETSVVPSTLALAPGESKAFEIRVKPTTTEPNVWRFGSLVWTDGSHMVKSPVTLQLGGRVSVPASLTAATTSGVRLLQMTTDLSGRVGSRTGGLKDVTMGPTVSLQAGRLGRTEFERVCASGVSTSSVKVYEFGFPKETVVARFELRQFDSGASSDDNNLLLLSPDGSSVYSGGPGSDESVQLIYPAEGSYKVCVNAAFGGDVLTHRLSSWIVPVNTVDTNLSVTMPTRVLPGFPASVAIRWTGLEWGGRYLGGIQFKDNEGLLRATTVLQINPMRP